MDMSAHRPTPPGDRVFLFLQGPHGPFFHALARMLRVAGSKVWRVGFNAGDRAFWFDPDSYIPFQDTQAAWPAFFRIARSLGISIHVFEEGYIRPYWVTYERGGSNGHSRLMEMSVAEMRAALKLSDMDAPEPPARWGDMRQHIFYGALYHWFVMFRNRSYANFRPHRDLPVTQEFQLYLRRLVTMPWHAIERRIAQWRIRNGGFPYHLALLQLEHDSSFRNHSPFTSMSEFLDVVIRGFAQGAPAHHRLVIKAHPLENGRVPLAGEIRRIAREAGITRRVHFVSGGKLAQLLTDARSAVTVNSTAAQQVLWRGIPLKVFGQAVYAKAEFVSDQPLQARLSGLPPLSAGNQPDTGRLLLDARTPPVAAAGGRYDAVRRRPL